MNKCYVCGKPENTKEMSECIELERLYTLCDEYETMHQIPKHLITDNDYKVLQGLLCVGCWQKVN